MDKLKQQIEQRLKANILIDTCAHCDKIIFRDAWCSQDRVIRFATPFFRQLFAFAGENGGRWGTGDSVMYEVGNGEDTLTIRCSLDMTGELAGSAATRERLLRACGISPSREKNAIALKTWEFASGDDTNKLFDDFDAFLANAVPAFEDSVKSKLASLAPEHFKEGAGESVTTNKYERNPKARAACLAAHGTACAVCGIDFGKEYGPEFEGKIEVHHLVPLSQIGAEYVVDPVRDMVPVCPNCHTALHSKKGGLYTVEELKKLRAGRNGK